MNITEKAAYLKGLMEGMQLDMSKSENKLMGAVVDCINDLALSVADGEDEMETLNAYIEEIDEDLGDLEELVYGDDCCDCDDWCDCEDCCDDDECDCGCECDTAVTDDAQN